MDSGQNLRNEQGLWEAFQVLKSQGVRNDHKQTTPSLVQLLLPHLKILSFKSPVGDNMYVYL